MKVCFIGKHKYPKDIFSNEQDMKTWRSMAAYFDELFVIAQSPDWFFHRAKEKNIRAYLVPKLFGYFGFVIFAVKLGVFLNLKYGVDVFDASEVAGGGVAVTFLKFLTGRPSVIEVQGEVFRKPEYDKNFSAQGGPASGWKSWLLQKIGRWAMSRAARVRVISHAIYDQVSAKGGSASGEKESGIDERKIRLVSLRVDLEMFKPKSDTNTRTHSNDTNKIVNIGYIGRLVDGKGLEDLLQAIQNLKSQISNFSAQGGPASGCKVLIFGNGSIEQKLKKMAQELGISDLIEWRGFVPYSKVPEALAEIDIFVYPSWHEGFGRSIMEALAMEKAVVATKVGGIPDLVRDGENGFLVEPHNPDQLAGKIKILLENQNLREKFGKAGRDCVSKNFEWNDGIKKFANLFLELK